MTVSGHPVQDLPPAPLARWVGLGLGVLWGVVAVVLLVLGGRASLLVGLVAPAVVLAITLPTRGRHRTPVVWAAAAAAITTLAGWGVLLAIAALVLDS